MPRPGPAKQVTDDELVEAIKTINDRFATPVEIADLVGLSPEHCRKRLKKLREDGVLDSKAAGNATAYWIA